MTGFARSDGSEGGYSWTWEAKSVNSKGLDLRFRLPPGFDHVEAAARALAGKRFSRGNLSINLVLQGPERPPAVRLNRETLDDVIAIVRELRPDREPDVETLLTLRGVVEIADEEEADPETVEKRDAAIIGSFGALAEALAEARREEGARLETVVASHIDAIAGLTEKAAGLAALQPERRSQRLRQQLEELLSEEKPVPEDRLAQEIALIVARGDVREELDRLEAHVEAARELMDDGGAVGRRLDFLCQEFNREANTLCSKSSDLELTRVGLDLKAAVERLREQIQNIE